jgi:oxygen-dependent protoporphyrinogen oxidase
LFIPAAQFKTVPTMRAAQFVRRRLGRGFERMAQPMIGGITQRGSGTTELGATLPRFLEMEQQHGSVIRAMWKQSGPSPGQ